MQAPLEAASYRLFSVLVHQESVEYPHLCDANPTTKKVHFGLAVHQLEKAGLVRTEILSEEDYLDLLADKGTSFLAAGEEFDFEKDAGVDEPLIVGGRI